jgi:hypothetical protein
MKIPRSIDTIKIATPKIEAVLKINPITKESPAPLIQTDCFNASSKPTLTKTGTDAEKMFVSKTNKMPKLMGMAYFFKY